MIITSNLLQLILDSKRKKFDVTKSSIAQLRNLENAYNQESSKIYKISPSILEEQLSGNKNEILLELENKKDIPPTKCEVKEDESKTPGESNLKSLEKLLMEEHLKQNH